MAKVPEGDRPPRAGPDPTPPPPAADTGPAGSSCRRPLRADKPCPQDGAAPQNRGRSADGWAVLAVEQ